MFIGYVLNNCLHSKKSISLLFLSMLILTWEKVDLFLLLFENRSRIFHLINIKFKDGAMGLSNFDIIHLVQYLNIPDFRGVFMRDTLPDKPREKECGVLNLNKSSEPGSHWVAFYKDQTFKILSTI